MCAQHREAAQRTEWLGAHVGRSLPSSKGTLPALLLTSNGNVNKTLIFFSLRFHIFDTQIIFLSSWGGCDIENRILAHNKCARRGSGCISTETALSSNFSAPCMRKMERGGLASKCCFLEWSEPHRYCV